MNFTDSLTRHGKDQNLYRFLLKKADFAKVAALLEENYQTIKPSPTPAIPKIIHQIWLGGNLPIQYSEWMKTWQNLPGFEYKLWTEDHLKDITLKKQSLFESTDNLGAKADVLRYEILYQQGGIYVDADIECIDPTFFEKSTGYDFFAGIEPIGQALNMWVGNSLIGAKPKHPLLKFVVDYLPRTYPESAKTLVNVTGPAYFTFAVMHYLKKKENRDNLLIFPTTFFNPLNKNEAWILTDEESKREIFKETASVHYFQKSWKDKTINKTILEKDASIRKILMHPKHRDYEKNSAIQKKIENACFKNLKSQYAIPRLIHQIDNPKSKRFLASWMDIADFDHRLWTPDELQLEFPESDDYSFDILNKYGGLFIDPQIFCLDEQFFYEAAAKCTFFAALEPLRANNQIQVSTALMASTSNNPMLADLKNKGAEAFLNQGDDTLLFPPSYFYPFTKKEVELNDIYALDANAKAVRYWLPLAKQKLHLKQGNSRV